MNIFVTALVVMAKISWYNPQLCELGPEFYVNCGNPAFWWRMSCGLYDAREHYWRALACPVEYPLNTQFVIEGSRYGLADGTWRCLARGGAIVTRADGTIILDLLTTKPVWGDVLPVRIIQEKSHESELAQKPILR